MSRFPQPPRKEELQRLVVPTGRPIYKDVDGVNEQDKYYIPDNVEGRKLRPIQTGRVYNFTGVERITALAKTFTDNLYTCAFWLNITGIESFYNILNHPDFNTSGINIIAGQSVRALRIYLDSAGADIVINDAYEDDVWARFVVTYDGTTCNVYKNGNITSIGTATKSITLGSLSAVVGTSAGLADKPFKIAKIQESNSVWTTQDIIDDYNGAVITKGSADNFLYWGDDAAGLVAYAALTINGNNGTIDLGGSSENSFHATDPDVPSRQNEVGYTQFNYNQGFVGLSSYPDGWEARGDIISVGADSEGLLVTVGAENAGLRYLADLPAYGFSIIRYRVKKISGTFENFSLVYSNAANQGFETNVIIGEWYDIDLTKAFISIELVHTEVQVRVNVTSGDQFVIQSYIQESDLKVPIAEDGDGKTNVLGNIVPHPYFGTVRKEALLTNASCMNFDGNLYGNTTIAKSVTDFIHQTGIFDITIKTSFGNGESTSAVDTLLSTTFASTNGFRMGYANSFNPVQGRLFFIFRDTGIGNTESGTGDLRSILNDGNIHEIRWVADGVNISLFVDGEPQTLDVDTITPRGGTSDRFFAVGLGDDAATNHMHNGLVTSVIVINDSEEEIINYKGSEVNGLIYFNTAIDRPANPDATVVLNGSSDGDQYSTSEFARPNNLLDGFTAVTYATGDQLVPADPANLGFDVQGNALGVKGSSIALNPSESKIIFNPYGDPSLHVMGLDDTIELGYADIVANESLFHDNKVENKVEKILAYSDFQYPIAGSAMQFDRNLWAEFSYVPTLTNFRIYWTFEHTNMGAGVEYVGKMPARLLKSTTDYFINASPTDPTWAHNDVPYHEMIITQLNGNINVIDNGVEVVDMVTDIGTITEIILGRQTAAASNPFEGKQYECRIVELNGSGDEIAELVNVIGQEEAGLTFFNIAADRPANSNASVILNGSPDGTPFAQLENKDYHHNLQYGKYDNGTSLVPGDPNNFGFDVNGIPIDDKPEVIKYRRIRQYLRK